MCAGTGAGASETGTACGSRGDNWACTGVGVGVVVVDCDAVAAVGIGVDADCNCDCGEVASAASRSMLK
jgi:hypothetical protein